MQKTFAVMTIFSFVAICGFCSFVVDSTQNNQDILGEVTLENQSLEVHTYSEPLAEGRWVGAVVNAAKAVGNAAAVVNAAQAVYQAGKSAYNYIAGAKSIYLSSPEVLLFELD